MIEFIAWLLQSDIAQMVIAAIGALGLAWGYGKAKERKGRKDAETERKAKQAEADTKARDKANEALRKERAADGGNAGVVERLRDRDAKWK